MSHLWTDVTSILLAFTGILLIFIILLQRGRGGGLAGAFGATGGQSAFGTKAGDVFTKITIVIAVLWVGFAGLTSWAMVSERSATRFKSEAPTGDVEKATPAAPAAPKDKPTEKAAPGKEAAPVFGAEPSNPASSSKTGADTNTQKSPPAPPSKK